MLIEREAYDVSEIIVSLGNLMRYSINKNNGIVSIEDEKDNILSYLLIQKNRMDDRLDYEFDISESLYNFMVPKLILQPLVENAILHGIEPQINGGYDLFLIVEEVERNLIDKKMEEDSNKVEVSNLIVKKAIDYIAGNYAKKIHGISPIEFRNGN